MKLIVKIDGEMYDVPRPMKLGEAQLIKDQANLGIAEIFPAIKTGDPNLLSALCQIVLARAGKPISPESLEDFDLTRIELDYEAEEDDDDVEPPASDPQPGAGGSDGNETETSDAGNSEATPPTPGNPSTDISVASPPETSTT